MPRGGKSGEPKIKGRTSAYAFFVQTCRAEHQKQHPEEKVVFSEFSKKCSERWATMKDNEKKRFYEMAEVDRKRVEEQMPSGGRGRGAKRKKAPKDPNAPKRNVSAFFWFCSEERPSVRAENPDWLVGDVAKELSKRWAEVEDRSKYEEMAHQDKIRYEKEKSAYEGRKASKQASLDDEDDELDEDGAGEVANGQAGDDDDYEEDDD